ncbi:sodium:proton exchanger [Prauserella rugosa]|uniref:Cation:H+ antiporter n=1 Tax=Prauserella rugosa TaxID=43354 RepID=A0A660CB50_9PSEU|nr:sodium:proton exchanger [Prauserella rugosa]KMS82842.1 sodium:proton exchanger [Streptomyces regensis]TWH20536.1 cation:H+ antiporter [Prauserella rugosa]
MESIAFFAVGAALLIYSAEKLVGYLVGVASGLRISLFLLAIIFTGIEFDDVALGVVLNMEDLDGAALGLVFGTALSLPGVVLALAALLVPTKINIPRSYLILYACSPLAVFGFVAFAPMNPATGILLLLLFGAFLAYMVVRESRGDRPIFRDAELYESFAAARERGGGTATLVSPPPTKEPPKGRDFSDTMPFAEARKLGGWAGLGLAVLALVGVVAGAWATGEGTEGILDQYGLEGTLFGATIATLVLTIEDIFLTVEPARRGAPEIGVANVIGSVVFSVTGKLGVILLAGGLVVNASVFTVHMPALLLLTALSAYFLSTGHLRRWHGVVLLGLYLVYWAVCFGLLGVVPVESD